jgi:hypothetical protein
MKWAGMRRALKPGGLLIIQGYTTKRATIRINPKPFYHATAEPRLNLSVLRVSWESRY